LEKFNGISPKNMVVPWDMGVMVAMVPGVRFSRNLMALWWMCLSGVGD
jgi:hypothetical protein